MVWGQYLTQTSDSVGEISDIKLPDGGRFYFILDSGSSHYPSNYTT